MKILIHYISSFFMEITILCIYSSWRFWSIYIVRGDDHTCHIVSCLFMAIVLLCKWDYCIYLQLYAELYHCIVLIGWLALLLGSSSLHFWDGLIMYFDHRMTPLIIYARIDLTPWYIEYLYCLLVVEEVIYQFKLKLESSTRIYFNHPE